MQYSEDFLNSFRDYNSQGHIFTTVYLYKLQSRDMRQNKYTIMSWVPTNMQTRQTNARLDTQKKN